MTRTSNRSDSWPWAALTILLCVGCAGRRGAAFLTATEENESPRRAPGVAIDRSAELPATGSEASTTLGVAQLVTPPDTSLARQTVRRFLELMLRGSFQELEPMMDEQAWFNTGPTGGRMRARHFVQTRLARLEYSQLDLNTLYRQSEVQTIRAEDARKLEPARALPTAVHGQDVMVRVFIATPRVGRERLFGDEVTFVLRPQGKGFSVVEIVEEFQLP